MFNLKTTEAKLSIANMSVQDICSGLLQKAYCGKVPEGGFDFPTTVGVVRVPEGRGDLHVDIKPYQEVSPQLGALSVKKHTKPVTRQIEIERQHTTSPFAYSKRVTNPIGLMGKALKAYGKVVAIMQATGNDYTAYDTWFRQEWNVDQEENLSFFIPNVRSPNAVLLAGLKRKLEPAIHAYTSEERQVHVKWHAVTRLKYGENAMVDWNRVSTIAKMKALEIFVEDPYYCGRRMRLDFCINPAEVPKAPSVRINKDAFAVKTAGHVVRNKGIVDYYSSFHGSKEMYEHDYYGYLEEKEGYEPNPEVALMLAVKNFVNRPTAMPTFVIATQTYEEKEQEEEQEFEDDEDLLRPTIPIDLTKFRYQYDDEFFNQILGHFMLKRKFTRNDLNDLKNVLHNKELSATVTDRQRIIDKWIPLDILKIFGIAVGKLWTSHGRAGKAVGRILKNFQISIQSGTSMNPILLWKNNRGGEHIFERIIRRLLYIGDRLIGYNSYRFNITSSLLSYINQSVDAADIVQKLVYSRRNFWANQYYDRALTSSDRVVEFQLRAKLMQKQDFKIDVNQKPMVTVDQSSTVKTLFDIIERYIDKRRDTIDERNKEMKKFRGTVKDIAELFDKKWKPKVKMKYIIDKHTQALIEIINDMSRFMQAALGYTVDYPPNLIEDTEIRRYFEELANSFNYIANTPLPYTKMDRVEDDLERALNAIDHSYDDQKKYYIGRTVDMSQTHFDGWLTSIDIPYESQVLLRDLEQKEPEMPRVLSLFGWALSVDVKKLIITPHLRTLVVRQTSAETGNIKEEQYIVEENEEEDDMLGDTQITVYGAPAEKVNEGLVDLYSELKDDIPGLSPEIYDWVTNTPSIPRYVSVARYNHLLPQIRERHMSYLAFKAASMLQESKDGADLL